MLLVIQQTANPKPFHSLSLPQTPRTLQMHHPTLTVYHLLRLHIGHNSESDMDKGSTSAFSSSVFANYPLISSLIAFTIAQSIKFFTSWFKENRWDVKQLMGSGGMPSAHSATVACLATAVGFQEGFEGALFASALILAFVVMYDATGVRLQAGRQAEVLNQLVNELPAEHPLAETRPLRELLGHTPPQVCAGALLGVVTASIGFIISLCERQIRY